MFFFGDRLLYRTSHENSNLEHTIYARSPFIWGVGGTWDMLQRYVQYNLHYYDILTYPLVNKQFAMENGHRHS